jgi:hypothetical protein
MVGGATPQMREPVAGTTGNAVGGVAMGAAGVHGITG